MKNRKAEVARLKREIKEMCKWMGISKKLFHQTLPRFKARGYKYYIDANGRKASIRQQWQFLSDMVELRKKHEEETKKNASST